MREASIPGYRLGNARRSTRVLITCALFGVFIGLLSAVAITLLKTGVDPRTVAEYYAGTEVDPTSIDALTASSGRPLAELAEITHLHLMGGSLLLFLLCHLLTLCSVSERTRTVLYLAAFGSFMLTFALPWGIVYLSRSCAYLFGPSVVLLIVSLLVCSAIPVMEMWGRR